MVNGLNIRLRLSLGVVCAKGGIVRNQGILTRRTVEFYRNLQEIPFTGLCVAISLHSADF